MDKFSKISSIAIYRKKKQIERLMAEIERMKEYDKYLDEREKAENEILRRMRGESSVSCSSGTNVPKSNLVLLY